MEGGIQQWQDPTAEGSLEAGIAYFAPGTSAADMAALAWTLEENTRLFYLSLAGMRPGTEEAGLFLRLVEAEEHHKGTLAGIHARLSSEPLDRFSKELKTRVLEGGVDLQTALTWAEGKPARKVLGISMGLEANAYDRYLKMLDLSEGEDAKEVFRTIAREEKGHLEKLSRLMDEAIKEGE